MELRRNRRIGRLRGPLVSVAVAAATLLALTACSGGASTEGSGESSSSTVVTDAMKPVTEFDAPTEAFTPPTGKHIAVVYCGGAAPGCVREGEEAKRVAESLGWTVDLLDGKLDPTVWNQVVKQAAESGVDGIISISADPNLFADAMQVVAAKDIPFVVAGQSPSETDVDGIDAYIGADPKVVGANVAEWIIADSGGDANILILNAPGFEDVTLTSQAIAEILKSDCADCKVEEVDIPVANMGTALAPLITNRLQTNPDIDYIWGANDCCVSFVQQGIREVGKTDTVKLVSGGGFPDQLSQLKTGEMAADLATGDMVGMWLAVDGLGRLMAGETTEQHYPKPQRLWTEGNIDEASPEVFTIGWNTEIDFEDVFRSLWGMSK